MSMRSFPGIDEASYQVSDVLVPSGLYVVLFCVKVMVRYHAGYRSCMARSTSSPLRMFWAVARASSRCVAFIGDSLSRTARQTRKDDKGQQKLCGYHPSPRV